MKSRFEPMVQTNIEKGYTTLWEYFQEGMGTYNHAWSGGSLFLLSKYVGGISSTSAGFKSYNIKPVLDNFETLETKVNTLDGDISVKKDGKTLTVTVPNGNGSLILDGVKSITTNNDDKCSVTNTESAITVKINEAGTYTFQYEK